MKINRLREIVAAYGAEPSRWPLAERAAAQGLIAADPAARGLVAEAAVLDRALDRVGAPAPAGTTLAAAIVGAARSRPQRRRSGFADRLAGAWPTPLWPQLAGLAAALVIGFAIGFTGIGAADADAATDPLLLLFGPAGLEDFAL
jgi:hypothetical protein